MPLYILSAPAMPSRCYDCISKGPLHVAGSPEEPRSSAVRAAISSLRARKYLFSEAKLTHSKMSSKRKRADDLPENPLAGLPLTGLLLQLLACRSPSTSYNVLLKSLGFSQLSYTVLMPGTGAPRLAVLSWLLPCAGALSKQVTDTTVSNQQPAKEGGPIKRKKATSLGALIEIGVIKDGAVLRYMKVTDHIQVPGLCYVVMHSP